MKLLLILIPTLALAQPQVEDAKKSIISLIQPLMASNAKTRPQGTENFRIDSCDKKKIDWMGILLMQKSVDLHFQFKPGCDIEGVITPKVLQFFPANLKLRNIKSYNKIQTQNKITANLDTKPILNLEMRQGVLSGKDLVRFEADYQVQLNPMEQNPIEKNLGGEIRILEINGVKSNIKEKILIN